MELLESTGLLQALVANVTQSAMPLEWVIAVLSFMVGILTGITQGQVAVVVPIVAAAARELRNAQHCHGLRTRRANADPNSYVPDDFP